MLFINPFDNVWKHLVAFGQRWIKKVPAAFFWEIIESYSTLLIIPHNEHRFNFIGLLLSGFYFRSYTLRKNFPEYFIVIIMFDHPMVCLYRQGRDRYSGYVKIKKAGI